MYFVMLVKQNGDPSPLVEYDEDIDREEIILYETYSEAELAACNNIMGHANGYIVYEWRVQK